ncbi:MAG: hypothetical protein LBM00_06845, partial [Deltaproteobacteria bacterium]|nr:hypothetical protein [Deltaproteobacteria bacterium]
GTGLKIKTIEALCYGKALVATSAGVEGILQRNTGQKAWLVAGDWVQFADFCAAVLKDSVLRRELEQGAREYAELYLSEDSVFSELARQLELACKVRQIDSKPRYETLSGEGGNSRPVALLFLDYNSPNIIRCVEALHKHSGLDYLLFHHHEKFAHNKEGAHLLPRAFHELLARGRSLPDTGRYERLSPEDKRRVFGLASLKELSLDAAAEIFLFLKNFFRDLIAAQRPDFVGVWCEFSPIQFGLTSAAESTGMPTFYIEYGSLPGTLMISFNGQIGKNEIAVNNDCFNSLPVDENEVAEAGKIISKIRETRLNRYAQEPCKLENPERLAGKKILFYAGINDLGSGNRPYDNTARRFHTPYFADTIHGLKTLCAACNNHPDWHVLFKPHPCMVSMRAKEYEPYRNHPIVTIVESGDIYDLAAMADVCLTILSQSVYMFSIEGKPSILLGNCEIRGKGCVYEYTGGDLEQLIELALARGYTQVQRNAFARHAAQLLKYSLFDDGQSGWGRPLASLEQYLKEHFLDWTDQGCL